MDRIIFSDNGTLIDYSTQLENFNSQTALIDYVAGEDYIYLGSSMPFNHKYIQISTANDETSSITVENWNGSEWKPLRDIIDMTSVGGKTLAQSGWVMWSTDKYFYWGSDDTDMIQELSSLYIYNMYWIRISFSADLNALTVLKYIGYRFANDEDVGVFYPELALANVMAQFKAGKTNWDEQHFAAAKEIIKDLQVKNVIVKPNQLLDWRTFRNASVHKLAEIVFNAFGDDFKDNRKSAQEYYGQAMKLVYANIDKDGDGNLSQSESSTRQGFLTR